MNVLMKIRLLVWQCANNNINNVVCFFGLHKLIQQNKHRCVVNVSQTACSRLILQQFLVFLTRTREVFILGVIKWMWQSKHQCVPNCLLTHTLLHFFRILDTYKIIFAAVLPQYTYQWDRTDRRQRQTVTRQ